MIVYIAFICRISIDVILDTRNWWSRWHVKRVSSFKDLYYKAHIQSVIDYHVMKHVHIKKGQARTMILSPEQYMEVHTSDIGACYMSYTWCLLYVIWTLLCVIY